MSFDVRLWEKKRDYLVEELRHWRDVVNQEILDYRGREVYAETLARLERKVQEYNDLVEFLKGAVHDTREIDEGAIRTKGTEEP